MIGRVGRSWGLEREVCEVGGGVALEWWRWFGGRVSGGVCHRAREYTESEHRRIDEQAEVKAEAL